MDWLVFSYSLPTTRRSSPRVALWRRLRRIGALPAKARAYVLPATDECQEAFQWLAQEVERAGGEALVMRTQHFEGLTDAELVKMVRAARTQDYQELERQATDLVKTLRRTSRLRPDQRRAAEDHLERLRRRYTEIARIDFFDAAAGKHVHDRLQAVERRLAQGIGKPAPHRVPSRKIPDYRDKRWVTRPRPHVDRLACAWLIRRFIDPRAKIRYGNTPEPNEIPFDMERGVFSHEGNLCTFEVMLKAFGMKDPVLENVAEIVHETDLRDARYVRPEAMGVDAILRGWVSSNLSDAEIEMRGIAVFDGLYASFSKPRRTTRA